MGFGVGCCFGGCLCFLVRWYLGREGEKGYVNVSHFVRLEVFLDTVYHNSHGPIDRMLGSLFESYFLYLELPTSLLELFGTSSQLTLQAG